MDSKRGSKRKSGVVREAFLLILKFKRPIKVKENREKKR